MREKLNVTVRDHASRMTPETLTSLGDHLLSVRAMASNVPPAPAAEEVIVD